MATIVKTLGVDYTCDPDDCAAGFLDAKDDLQGSADPVILVVPPDVYNYKANDDRFPFDGIPNLTVHGYGATLTDDTGPGGISWGTQVGIPVALPQSSVRIQTALRGDRTIALVTPGDISVISAAAAAGQRICFGAFDMQGGGSDPPNPFYSEFAEIESVNTGAKTFTLTKPLRESYLSTFPEYDTGDAGHPDLAGRANVWVMPPNWNTSITIRGLTADINTVLVEGVPTPKQTFGKGKFIRFHDVPVTGPGTIIPTVNELFVLSGPRSNFPGGEFDKLIDVVRIENGATMVQPLIQSSCGPNLMIVDGGNITTLNGTARRTIVRNNSHIGTLKLGALGYGRTDYYDQVGGTIGAITWNEPQYDVSAFPISGGLITKAISTGPVRFGMPDTHVFMLAGHTNDFAAKLLSCLQLSTNAKIQTDLPGGWPTGVTKVGPHPCPSLRFKSVTGCNIAVDLSQAEAYNLPFGSYSKRTYNGLVGDAAEAVEIWGVPVVFEVDVTSAAAGTLKVLGQHDNYPTRKMSDGSTFSYAPTVDLSQAGLHSITLPEPLWFTGPVTPFCTSTTAGFSVKIKTDQGIVNYQALSLAFG